MKRNVSFGRIFIEMLKQIFLSDNAFIIYAVVIYLLFCSGIGMLILYFILSSEIWNDIIVTVKIFGVVIIFGTGIILALIFALIFMLYHTCLIECFKIYESSKEKLLYEEKCRV